MYLNVLGKLEKSEKTPGEPDEMRNPQLCLEDLAFTVCTYHFLK